jgi:hypothetical protein
MSYSEYPLTSQISRVFFLAPEVCAGTTSTVPNEVRSSIPVSNSQDNSAELLVSAMRRGLVTIDKSKKEEL